MLVMTPANTRFLGGDDWTPRQIPGLVAWLDARYLTGVADGGAVASAAGRSGKGEVFIQGTPAQQPLWRNGANGINGRPALQFDGSDDNLRCDALASVCSGEDRAWMVALVAYHGPTVIQDCLWGWGSSGGTTPYAAAWWDADNTRLRAHRIDDAVGPSGDQGTPVGSVVAESTHVYVVRCEGATASLWIDGTKHVSGGAWNVGASTVDRFAVGALVRNSVTLGWQGLYGSVLVYNRAPIDAEVARVWRYLDLEWGL